MSRNYLLLLIFHLFCLGCFAQLTLDEEELLAPTYGYSRNQEYLLNMNLMALASSGEQLPFWMYQNTRGRITAESQMAAWISGKTVIFLSDESEIFLGAGALYLEGSGIVADELYAHFQNQWMYLTVGRKQRPEKFNGLSATNGNLLWSLNARPLPGIQIGTAGPVFLFSQDFFGIETAWNEYLLDDDRYVEGARVHHKNFHLVFKKPEWYIKAGFQHFAQWAGVSPRTGQQPKSFKDYLQVWTGKEGANMSSSDNRIKITANHLGVYELEVGYSTRNSSLQFMYSHIFDDLSGRRFQNFPDGSYGIYYENKTRDAFVTSILYEFYYTQHQSYTASGFHKYDNYFNNATYASGWTYGGKTLGNPFFTAGPNGSGIINNKYQAHHFGISGQVGNYFHTFPYKFMLSYAHNEGTYVNRYMREQDVFYGMFETGPLHYLVDFNLQLGFEFKSSSAPIFGSGLQMIYRF